MKSRSLWVLALVLGTAAQAQSPAEMPPAGYAGQQYVDSAGCVFARAQVNGDVTWVPLIGRDRAPVCNRTPTPIEVDEVVAVPPAETGTETTPEPVRPATPPTVASAEPEPRDPKSPLPMAQVPKPRATASKPARAAALRTPSRTVVVTRVPGPPAGTVLRKEEIPPGVRVVPRHVYENNRGTRVQTAVPQGYRPAFTDDRLNPRRAEMTRSGIYSTERLWTNTVPRKLRRGDAGRDGASYRPAPAPEVSSSGKAVTRSGTLSSRSAPAASGHRWVQVGSFGVAANADKAARRLKAAGLPVRYGRHRSGQGELRVVLAGPFASGAEVAQALDAARRAGFSDAFPR